VLVGYENPFRGRENSRRIARGLLSLAARFRAGRPLRRRYRRRRRRERVCHAELGRGDVCSSEVTVLGEADERDCFVPNVSRKGELLVDLGRGRQGQVA
jgi:hypothetical protein